MIKIGIVGYGNLGRGVECAVLHSQDGTNWGFYKKKS